MAPRIFGVGAVPQPKLWRKALCEPHDNLAFARRSARSARLGATAEVSQNGQGHDNSVSRGSAAGKSGKAALLPELRHAMQRSARLGL